MEVSAMSIEAFFAPVGETTTSHANAGIINNHFATIQILDNPPAECANHEEFTLAQQTPCNQDSPSSKFAGTSNLRHLRAIAALMRRPMPRESLDKEAGCSNGPELVAELRRRGLETPCERIKFINRDGHLCHPGVYHFTETDRRKVKRWMATRQSGGVDLRLACWLSLAAVCLMLIPGAF